MEGIEFKVNLLQALEWAVCFVPWDSLQESGAGFVNVELSGFTLGERERGEKTSQKSPHKLKTFPIEKGVLISPVFHSFSRL